MSSATQGGTLERGLATKGGFLERIDNERKSFHWRLGNEKMSPWEFDNERSFHWRLGNEFKGGLLGRLGNRRRMILSLEIWQRKEVSLRGLTTKDPFIGGLTTKGLRSLGVDNERRSCHWRLGNERRAPWRLDNERRSCDWRLGNERRAP